MVLLLSYTAKHFLHHSDSYITSIDIIRTSFFFLISISKKHSNFINIYN